VVVIYSRHYVCWRRSQLHVSGWIGAEPSPESSQAESGTCMPQAVITKVEDRFRCIIGQPRIGCELLQIHDDERTWLCSAMRAYQ
jgi:hypothetical protein